MKDDAEPAAKAVPTTADLNRAIDAAPLTDASKRNYKERISFLEKTFNVPMLTIMLDPKTYIARIRETYDKETTRKNYMTIVLSLFRHMDKVRHDNYQLYKLWKDAFSDADKKVEERYKQNAPTEKQTAGYVPFKDITAMRDALPNGSMDRLVLAMYTHIPPLRADFGNVRLYRSVPAKPSLNYIHIHRGGCKLVLTEYKTSGTHGKFEKVLPPPLCADIHGSLTEKPRDYLFVKRSGDPYENANAYTRFINKTLQRLFKKPLTISLIRHSFISTLDFNTLTIAEKEAIANDMLHTTRLQDQYRLIFKAKTDDTPAPTEEATK